MCDTGVKQLVYELRQVDSRLDKTNDFVVFSSFHSNAWPNTANHKHIILHLAMENGCPSYH